MISCADMGWPGTFPRQSGFPNVSAADDHCRAEALIADQVQEVRINDRACRIRPRHLFRDNLRR